MSKSDEESSKRIIEVKRSPTERPTWGRRWVPIDASLKKAAAIAERSGEPFDPSKTDLDGRNLLSHYFDDICTVLAEVDGVMGFDHSSTNRLQTAVEFVQDEPRVFMDEHLHFWLFGLNHIATLSACYHFDEHTLTELKALTLDHFRMYLDPIAVHYRLRDDMWPWNERYVDLLPAANALTQ